MRIFFSTIVSVCQIESRRVSEVDVAPPEAKALTATHSAASRSHGV
jgi:hypothetical protein